MLASRLLTGAGLTLAGWLAAQCVLQLGASRNRPLRLPWPTNRCLA